MISRDKFCFADYESLLSKPRLSRYLDIANGDEKAAIKYYLANIELAAKLFPLIHLFEISTRNAINKAIGIHLGAPDWIDSKTNRKGIFNLAAISPNDNQIIKGCGIIKGRLRKQAKTVTPERIISETTLGFWVETLASKYDPVLADSAHEAFQFKPSAYSKKSCKSDMDSIRDYRNRISHHDTLFIVQKVIMGTKHDVLSTERPLDVYNKLIRLSGYIDPVLVKMLKQHDGISQIIQKIKRV